MTFLTRSRRGWTLVEIMVASALLSLVIGAVYGLISLTMSNEEASVGRRTATSYLRQDARIGLEKLLERLESSIEILVPEPGQVADSLEFRDLLNHDTKLTIEPGTDQLVSFSRENNQWTREDPVTKLTTRGGEAFDSPVKAIKIPRCKKVVFKVFSPTLVSIELTVEDSGRQGTLVTMVHLRNSRLVGS